MDKKLRIFTDGSSGTTGLRIRERLSAYAGAEIITLPDDLRKDPAAKSAAMNSADFVFLCLPDDAARESVALINNPDVTVIDTSTAHRTAPGWAYGFPELSGDFRSAVASSKRIAVPGCHASGFVALVYPLVSAGIIPPDADLTCFSVTGYSGGGKKMIAEYECDSPNFLLGAPRQYGLTQNHKHLAEMRAVCGLGKAPLFCPIVSDFYSGMTVTVALPAAVTKAPADEIRNVYSALYSGPIVTFDPDLANDGFISANLLHGKDSMKITVAGNDERILLIAAFDNLGKGASGAAVECMNIAAGGNTTKGLVL